MRDVGRAPRRRGIDRKRGNWVKCPREGSRKEDEVRGKEDRQSIIVGVQILLRESASSVMDHALAFATEREPSCSVTQRQCQSTRSRERNERKFSCTLTESGATAIGGLLALICIGPLESIRLIPGLPVA